MVQTQTLNRLPAWFLTHGGGEFDLLEGATPNLASRAIHKTGTQQENPFPDTCTSRLAKRDTDLTIATGELCSIQQT